MIYQKKFEIYDSGKRREFSTGAVRDVNEDKGRMDLLSPFANIRTAKWLQAGAKKYGDRNWERGIPFSCLLDSVLRHLYKYQAGMRDEDHLAAARFGIDAMMHFEALGREDLMDLPQYLKSDEPHSDEPSPEIGEAQADAQETYAEKQETPGENWFTAMIDRLRR